MLHDVLWRSSFHLAQSCLSHPFLRALGDGTLPADLFRGVSPRILDTYRQRAAAEESYEIRRHPEALRATLLAVFCWTRQQEIVDAVKSAVTSEMFRKQYADVFLGDALWQSLPAPTGDRFVWQTDSTADM